MNDHTRMPGATRDGEAGALQIADEQELLANAIDAVNRLGAAMAAATIQRNLAAQAAAEAVDVAAWGTPPTVGAWYPNPGIDSRISLGEAVGQALGSAAMCWRDPETGQRTTGALIYDSGEAVRVFEGIVAWLDDWAHEQAKQANERTAAKLLSVVKNFQSEFKVGGGVWAALDALKHRIEGE